MVTHLIKKGIKVIDDRKIKKIEKKGINDYLIVTEDEEKFQTNLVGAFFGLKPEVDFLLDSELMIDRGIIVDEYLRTNIKDVLACGDCAQIYNNSTKSYLVSIGWENAIRLGKIAGQNIIGFTEQAKFQPDTILSFDGIKVKTKWWIDIKD